MFNSLRLANMVTVALFLTFLVFIGCSDEESDPKVEIALPSVTTAALLEITDTGAKAGGNVTSAGGGTISARGVVWGSASGPTVALTTKTSDGTGTGEFASTIAGLTPGTKYFVRAYATNETGTSYGDEFTVTPRFVFADFDNALSANMATYKIPALSIAIVRNEKLVYVKSYGTSDKEASTLATNNDRYRVASLSKPITQAIILKLISDGSLSLDSKVFGSGSILGAEYGTPPAGSKKDLITIKHLIDHTSGWTNSPNDPMFNNLTWSQSDIIKDMLSNRALTNAPGAKYYYLNFGYLVLGRVIEKVTQKGYEEYVRSVFATMGITDMQIAGNTLAERLPAEVKYYQSEYDPYSMNVKRMDAHGGWVATSTDLARFIVRIDRQSSITDAIPATLLNETYFGYENWYHTGSLPGTSAILCRFNDNVSFVVLANSRTESNIDAILQALYNTMRDKINARTEWPAYDLF